MRLILLGLVAASTAGAQTIDTVQIDNLARKAVADKHMVGLSLGVMQNGKVVFAKGYGVRDLKTKAPVTPQTTFAIGSVTKQFTCGSLFMLAEEKKLSITDPVSKYFPKLTRANDITLIDLGNMVSGYRDYYPLDYVDREMLKPAKPEEIINRYGTRPLDFEPGSRYSYSNTGFMILGRVIEQASGQSYASFLSQRILGPLKMQHTSLDPAIGGEGMATGYTPYGILTPEVAAPEAHDWLNSAAGIWSTPTDLLAWDKSLIDHTLFKESSFRTMTTARRLNDGRSTGYGCGDGVNDRGTGMVVSHGGAVSGFVSRNTVIPATKSAVVLLANADFSSIGDLGQAIAAKLLPKAEVPVVVRGTSAIDAGRAYLLGLEKGVVDRSMLTDDFSAYSTPAKIAAARAALNAMGPISKIQFAGTSERGGLEVATIEFNIGMVSAEALMYRRPDGKIDEFLYYRN